MLTLGDIKPMSGEKTPGAPAFTQWGWDQEPVHEAPPPSPSLLPKPLTLHQYWRRLLGDNVRNNELTPVQLLIAVH